MLSASTVVENYRPTSCPATPLSIGDYLIEQLQGYGIADIFGIPAGRGGHQTWPMTLNACISGSGQQHPTPLSGICRSVLDFRRARDHLDITTAQ